MIEFLIKYKELIVIFSGIGTFISALIAVFTLKEVKKQRLSLYQPDILIKSFLVSISKSPLHKENEELIEYKTCDFNDYSNNYNEIEFEVSSKYKIDNLGFGIAKNIKCTWQFDTKKAIKKIEKLLPTNYQFSWHKNLNLYFLNNLENEDFHYSANANIGRQEIDYISPINVQKNNHLHTIPEIVIFTHYLFLLFENNLTDKEGKNFNVFEFCDYKFPNPVLKVEYKDLNGKKYKYEYKFQLSAVDTQVQEKLDLTKEFAYLHFELI
ncbi:hypothetical protein [Marinifilum flexuosum]|uniref:Uncharacterized protein n=1 Tax=Marinifilum flexuosum TaxID=1117708 RepID=A0A419WF53_9BACT|nr:hypothetical protein [Marinifilum flexuosum]RKD94083.1 hypothetical protein BXY64_4246 [Marinifilum flexuosum]